MGKKKTKRPNLNKIPVPVGGIAIGTVNITISPGQWDEYFSEAYKAGFTLFEVDVVDGAEQIVAAYRQP